MLDKKSSDSGVRSSRSSSDHSLQDEESEAAQEKEEKSGERKKRRPIWSSWFLRVRLRSESYHTGWVTFRMRPWPGCPSALTLHQTAVALRRAGPLQPWATSTAHPTILRSTTTSTTAPSRRRPTPPTAPPSLYDQDPAPKPPRCPTRTCVESTRRGPPVPPPMLLRNERVSCEPNKVSY